MALSVWARRRKRIYGTGVILFLTALIVPTLFFTLHTTPTCFDGTQNQRETAVDRGGPCNLLDSRFLQKAAVLWVRPFPIRNGFYNAVAYVENVNKVAGARNVPYRFKLYDKNNILVAERVGKTTLYPGKVFPVFEGLIDAGKRIPVRATFSLLDTPVWERGVDQTRGLMIFNKKTSMRNTTPRIDASVKNTTVQPYRNIVLVATLFDESGNAINASRTLISRIKSGETLPIAFTWPLPFSQNIARVDIVPLLTSLR